MSKKIFAVIILSLYNMSLCSCGFFNSSSSSGDTVPPETVIVKETVLVTEEKAESDNKFSIAESDTDDNSQLEISAVESSESAGNSGYTTSDVLKKAAEAANKQYWIVYYSGGKLRMSSFNALEGFTVTLKSDSVFYCDKIVGDATLFCWDDNKNGFSEGGNHWMGDKIIGGNCDVYDEKNDTTIGARTE